MTFVHAQGVGGEVLAGLELGLGAGIHVILGGPADGRDELVRMLTGLGRPRRGRIRIRGRDPRAHPETRARIAAVLHDEPEAPARQTVVAFVRAVLAWRRSREAPEHALDRLGLGAIGPRRLASLDPDERRSVAAVLAAALESPALVCVSEPLARLPGVDLLAWQTALIRAGEGGACVVLATASAEDGGRFADMAHTLEHGRLVRPVPLVGGGLAARAGSADLVARCADPRRLVQALTVHEDVTAVVWDTRISPDAVRVSGNDLERLCTAVLEASQAGGVELRAFWPVRPDLENLQAESAARARLAYEAALGGGARRERAPEPGGPT
jgi:ABC-2 type transport system ATP-binding protein